MRKQRKHKEKNQEQVIGEIHIKSKYELFGVKQKEDEDEKVISIEEIEKIKKFLSFAIRNFRKRFFDVYRTETDNFPKSEFSSELLKINSDFFKSGKTFSADELEKEVIKLLDAVKEKRERGQIISISATISVRNEDILLILTKMEKVKKKGGKLVEIWSSVAFLIKAVEITN